MSYVENGLNLPASGMNGETIHVDLSKADVAVIIDALLQAEITLPLVDRRYRAMKAVDVLRKHQLTLANRLEDLMSATIAELSQKKAPPTEVDTGEPAARLRREGRDT